VKLLTLDIETSPNLAYVWGLWDQNVGLSQLAEASEVMCFAAKWHGTKKVEFYSNHHDGHDEMIAQAHRLMDEADAIITYNGRSFDMKHLRREMVLAGMTPPSPHKDIDLINTVRQQFRFASNKLEHVAGELGIGHKLKHQGFEMWLDCIRGDEKAWATFERYCQQDVLLTERLYDRLLPWINNHPHHGLHVDEGSPTCQNCGGADVMQRGWATTVLGRYRRFQCKTCGKWLRGRHVEKQAWLRSAS
jgi:DNA polymerase elongation subunit (family B)